jgi:hypothetical protein
MPRSWTCAGALGVAITSSWRAPPRRVICSQVPPDQTLCCAPHILNHRLPSCIRFFESFFKNCSLAETLNSPPATRQEPPRQYCNLNSINIPSYNVYSAFPGVLLLHNTNMAAGQYDNSAESKQYIMSPDINPGMYYGTLSESSASSPMNCNVSGRFSLL